MRTQSIELLEDMRESDLRWARKDLLEFILEIMPQYKVNFHHRIICDRLTKLLWQKGQRLIVCVPPQYGKSQIVSRCLPAFVLGNDPKAKIIMGSYSASLSMTFNRAAQAVMESERYRQIFPDTLIRPFAPRKFMRTAQLCETSEYGYLYTVGVGGSTTGRSADPLLIIDDPFKDWKEALSPVRRQNVIDWFGSVIESRLSLNANVVIVQTRWHEGDLSGYLLKRALEDKEATQWELLNFPAIVESMDELHPEDPRKMGEALWPEVKGDAAKLSRIKKDVGSYIFAALWQQRPRSATGNIVDPKWWRRYRVIPHDFEEMIISCDAAFKDFETSDYVVIQVWGRRGVDKYLVDQRRDHMDIIRTCKELVNMKVKYPDCDSVYVEDKANGTPILQLLKKKVSGLIAVEPEGSKVARVHSVSPQIEAGNVYLPDESIAPFPIDKFIEEFSNFPLADNDDQVDAATQALEKLSEGENHYLRALLGKE
jgi:predicted phage terminase large subunit-like protein